MRVGDQKPIILFEWPNPSKARQERKEGCGDQPMSPELLNKRFNKIHTMHILKMPLVST